MKGTNLEFGRCWWDIFAFDDDVMLLSGLLPFVLGLVADVVGWDPTEEDTERRDTERKLINVPSDSTVSLIASFLRPTSTLESKKKLT